MSMGDRRKLNTATLELKRMETREFEKYVDRLKKSMETQILNLKCEQTLVVKRFERNLTRSAKIAKNHEETIKNFPSTRRRIERELYQEAWKNAFSGASNPKQKTGTPDCSGKSPAVALKEFHSTFQVPYKKEHSIQRRDLSTSATVLDIRCSLWKKVSNCIEQKTRPKSAPPWASTYKPPLRVQNAHTNALKTLGIRRWLVQPLSGQLQIDEIKLQKRRTKENEIESKAISDFIETLAPLKIQPGPTQTIVDANEMYSMAAGPNELGPKV